MDDLSVAAYEAQQVKCIREAQGVHQGDVYLSRLPFKIQFATLEILANDPQEVEGAVQIEGVLLSTFEYIQYYFDCMK